MPTTIFMKRLRKKRIVIMSSRIHITLREMGKKKNGFRSVYQSWSSANRNSEPVAERGKFKAFLWLC